MTIDTEKKPKLSASEKEQAIIEQAIKRFDNISTVEASNRLAALEDLKFVYNVDEGQWDAGVRQSRVSGQYKRPCLTVNKLRKFLARIAGMMRDARIGINVVAGDASASPELVDTMQTLLTQIEYDSNADNIYADAGERALASGWAYWRIIPKYEEDSFEQVIKIEKIDNPFNVYLDEKRRFCFIKTWMTEDEFKREFPKAKDIPKDSGGFDLRGLGEDYRRWFNEDMVQVCEYFEKVPVKKFIIKVQSPDGTSYVRSKELGERESPPNVAYPYALENGEFVVAGRIQNSYKIIWRKISAFEILDERDYPGKYIPVVEVCGEKINIQGKIYKKSLIRDVKDLQMIYNYFITTNTEKVALTPKAPYIVTPQEIAGFENMWRQANDVPFPFLFYNAQGSRVPRREIPGSVDTAAAHLLGLVDSDIKDVLGQYDSSIGAPSNDRTGRAILARKASSDAVSFMFHDNLARAMLESANIIVDLIPYIYDTPRTVSGADRYGNMQQVTINTKPDNTIKIGKYKLVTTLRPYNTRREETLNAIKDAIQYVPQLGQVLTPLLFKYMDSAGAKEISDAIIAFQGQQAAAQQAEQGGVGATQESLMSSNGMMNGVSQ